MGGIEAHGVDDLCLTIFLKEGLEDEEAPLPIAPPCVHQTNKRVESLHML